MVSSTAALFTLITGFGIYIFVKYLIFRSECKRIAMMFFYGITIADLALRCAVMISLNYRSFFAEETLILSVISLFAALLVGSANAYILCSLITDLKLLMCLKKEQLENYREQLLVFLLLRPSYVRAILSLSFSF